MSQHGRLLLGVYVGSVVAANYLTARILSGLSEHQEEARDE